MHAVSFLCWSKFQNKKLTVPLLDTIWGSLAFLIGLAIKAIPIPAVQSSVIIHLSIAIVWLRGTWFSFAPESGRDSFSFQESQSHRGLLLSSSHRSLQTVWLETRSIPKDLLMRFDDVIPGNKANLVTSLMQFKVISFPAPGVTSICSKIFGKDRGLSLQ